MERKSLPEICKPKQWKTISTTDLVESGYPVYGANGIIGYFNSFNHESPTILITCRGATCGEIHKCKAKSYVNGNAMALDDLSSEINIDYLYYYLKSYDFNKIISGTAQPQITKEGLKNLFVSYPPLETQKKIVTMLDKAQELIDKRKEQMKLLDELIQSVFYIMFGDPVTNPKGWEKRKIGDTIQRLTAGWSVDGEARKLLPEEKAVLKVSAVTQGYFKEEEYKVIPSKQEIKKYVYPQKGDLLFSRANTRELVGATCIINKDYPNLILPDKLWKIQFFNIANVCYMKQVMSHKAIRSKFSIQSTGTSGSMFNVSMDKFKSIRIPLPPISLQTRFAELIEIIEQQRDLMYNSLGQMEDNFNSIIQRAFNGKLFN